jgi:flagellar biosynthesis protein FliP
MRALIVCLSVGVLTLCAAAAPEDVVKSLFGGSSTTIDIIILLTAIALVPSLLIMLTGFTRIVIVLSFVRNALGLQNMPPNTVIIGIALFLTYFVMNPVLTQVYDAAYVPYEQGDIELAEFSDKAMSPLREFMLKQTYDSDLDFFANLDGLTETQTVDEIPNRVVIPAFMTSELKHAFQIGFFIYIPFIVIDMVVSSTLMAMGMMMLPPAMISMPFKILLFVLVDGWQLTMGTIVKSFG